MFSKSRGALVLATYLAVLSTAGCTSISQTVTQLISDPVQTNVLSGREGENGPVLVVKIDDTRYARPQIGLEFADVVYIEQVEGGLTRLAAVFSSTIPPRIGPVRSARISDIEILAQYGKVGFAYSGAQQKLTAVINASNLFNMSAEKFGYWEPYFRDNSRYAPVNLYINPNTLLEKAHAKDIYFEKVQPTFLAESITVPLLTSLAISVWAFRIIANG